MKNKKKLKRILIAGLIVAAIAGLYAYKEFNRKNKSLHDIQAVANMQAAEITTQFNSNEKKATAAYAGKAVLVSGIIKTIDKDEKGFYTIVLGNENSMSSVRCSIDSTESSLAANEKPGSLVKVKGICTGYVADELGLGSDVIFNRCVIETGK